MKRTACTGISVWKVNCEPSGCHVKCMLFEFCTTIFFTTFANTESPLRKELRPRRIFIYTQGVVFNFLLIFKLGRLKQQ